MIIIKLETLLFRLFRILQRRFLVKKFSFGVSTYLFSDYFKGFEKLDVVKTIFGNKTNTILGNLKVDLTWFGGYMFVDDFSGHLVVSSRYLKKGNKIDIYLDLIHELFHIKQFLEGKNLFDHNYSYVDRPTEIEAYTYTIKEARRIGLTDKRILTYLKTEWITPKALKRLAKNLNVNY